MAIEHAADIWGSILVSDVPIKVAVSWTALGSAALGVTFPNGRKDFINAPVAATWYATSLANSLTGFELNPGEDDINIYLNSGTNWYTGTDGNTPAGQYDLVSVALHELGHGIGFVGLAKKVGSEGSFGLLQASDFAPLITTFPWPQQDTLPGIFDRFLRAPTLEMLVDVPNPSVPLGSFFTCNQLTWNGPNGLAASGGGDIRIYAPSTFALGSSCVHLNEATYPAGNPHELMTPFSSAGHSNHWPGPICIGMLRDIGWNLAPGVGMDEPAMEQQLVVFPNPVNDLLTFSRAGMGTSYPFRIVDLSGRTMLLANGTPTVDVSALAAGTYLLMGAEGKAVRFVKH
ncbi:MAG: T9SS type A sorting domain-containing protein [Flavobacteriales bacterium]|nr:T9SS type A sorting domain-containing protein [Flavobacteriales bacterium]